ncbi:uncharacterized protein LACBIDRAFT_303191 [Laccaria bicolor S238N-H82]|uniref:Predicted protein n=1 Tax=Laccaria bicolor (strain S238N-H82 / ATCC MYA-4686) TaxID=486041 RepID=B0DJ37_LACBS|nr:uncharacterized protein LACBIDRAFT_303191 [Laccaria bicolor S238N-H82]EDR05335.1 predicted protein [Laccaria bicolor S238N-H82]|eukprot:XP_001883893.1 predicted protein [Laccaria bicolor S238N-H82]
MSNELERELILYNEFERTQRATEAERLLQFTQRQQRARVDAMVKKAHVKSCRAVTEEGKEVWPAELVKVIFSTCAEETERLGKAKTPEAFTLNVKCSVCITRGVSCQPKVGGTRTDKIGCATCGASKVKCNRGVLYMYEKFRGVWQTLGYTVAKDDFMTWYPVIMKRKDNKYVVFEGKGDNKAASNRRSRTREDEEDGEVVEESPKKVGRKAHAAAGNEDDDEDEEDGEDEEGTPKKMDKGKGKVKGTEEDEDDDEEDDDEEETGDVGLGEERPSSLKVKIPGTSRSTTLLLAQSSRGPVYSALVLRSRIQALESELAAEQVNSEHLIARRRFYKSEYVAAQKEVERLTAEVKVFGADRAQFVQRGEELEKLALVMREVEELRVEARQFEAERLEFQRQREEYERLRESEGRRAALMERMIADEKERELRRAELADKGKEIEQEMEARGEEWKEQMLEFESVRVALQRRIAELEAALERSGSGGVEEGSSRVGGGFLVEEVAAILPLLRSTCEQNAELRGHVEAFQTVNSSVWTLLEAMSRDPNRIQDYLKSIEKKVGGVLTRGLLLPEVGELFSAVEKLESCLGRLQQGGEVRTGKRIAEDVGEGSEERRKRRHGSEFS